MIAFITMINGSSILQSCITRLAPLGFFLFFAEDRKVYEKLNKGLTYWNVCIFSNLPLFFSFHPYMHNRITDAFWAGLRQPGVLGCFFPLSTIRPQNNNTRASSRMSDLWPKSEEKSFSHFWQPLWFIGLMDWENLLCYVWWDGFIPPLQCFRGVAKSCCDMPSSISVSLKNTTKLFTGTIQTRKLEQSRFSLELCGKNKVYLMDLLSEINNQ